MAGNWRVLRQDGGDRSVLLVVDFGPGRPEASFADLAALLGPGISVWEPVFAPVRAGAGTTDPHAQVAGWVADARDAGVVVRGVLGYCAGAALACLLGAALGAAGGDVPPVVLLDPTGVDGDLINDLFASSVRTWAELVPEDRCAEALATVAGVTAALGSEIGDRPVSELADAMRTVQAEYDAVVRLACDAVDAGADAWQGFSDRFASFLGYLVTAGRAVRDPGPVVPVTYASDRHEPRPPFERVHRRFTVSRAQLLTDTSVAQAVTRATAGAPAVAHGKEHDMHGAIVGFGTIAMGHLTGYARTTGLSVVAAVDVSPERRRAAEAHGLRAYGDVARLLAEEHLDFIDICTPPNVHGHYSALGLANGLHVLCEKPVFLPDEDGFAGLMDAVWGSDLVFYPCHVYKFAPILAAMKEITLAPDFGDVLTANFRTLRHGHARGVQDWRPDWRREPEISVGGILRDHGPHSIYLAMDLTGKTPLAVSCLTGRLRDGGYQDTEDTALLRIRCTDGAEINLSLSWAADHRSTSYSIAGASGLINVDGDELTRSVDGRWERSVITSGFDDPSHKEWFADMLRDFQESVANPGRQDRLIWEALMTAYVLESAYESAQRNGGWVDVRVPAAMLRPSLSG